MKKGSLILLSMVLLFAVLPLGVSHAADDRPIQSGVPVAGQTISSKDVHTYRFTTAQDGEVRIELDQTTAGYSMYLYDSNDNSLGGDYYSSRGNSIVIYKKVKQGTYTIKVSPYSWDGVSSGSYALKATYAASITRDSATFEPNNTVETAYPVESGVYYKSNSTSGIDLDVYQFTTSQDGEVNIALEKTTAGYSMYLYDSDGNSLGGDYYSSGGNAVSIIKNLVKGTYYIKVAPYSWNGTTEGSYRLRATYSSDIKRDPVTYEPNETPGTSFPIRSAVTYTSTSESNLDLDVYTFTTAKDGEVRVELDNTSAGYSMYLYDSNGRSLGGDYYSSSGNAIVIYINISKGTYFIRVSPYSWSSVTKGSYRVKATYASAISHNEKTYEPNNTVETGFPIASDMSYTSKSESSIDLDVYSFTTSRDGDVEVTLDKTTAGYSMYVYDTDGRNVGGDYYSSGGNTITVRTSLKKGTYYVKVSPYSWSGVSSGTYRIKANYPVIRKVVLNGQMQRFLHLSVNGVVFVPAKDVASKTGAKVSFDAAKKAMTISRGKQKAVIRSGLNTVLVNGNKVRLSAAVRTINGTLWVPATMFRDAFGAKVVFDNATHTIRINLK